LAERTPKPSAFQVMAIPGRVTMPALSPIMLSRNWWTMNSFWGSRCRRTMPATRRGPVDGVGAGAAKVPARDLPPGPC
jgi:hypothetical protein